jgi:hypothetical protein
MWAKRGEKQFWFRNNCSIEEKNGASSSSSYALLMTLEYFVRLLLCEC